MSAASNSAWAVGWVVISAGLLCGCGASPDAAVQEGTPAYGAVALGLKGADPQPDHGRDEDQHGHRAEHGKHEGITKHCAPKEDLCHRTCDVYAAGSCGAQTPSDCYTLICDPLPAGKCDAELQAYIDCAATSPNDCSLEGYWYTNCLDVTLALSTCLTSP